MNQTDRNLLFGILAVQMNFVARDALIAAIHAWLLEKSQPLGRILVEQHVLSPSRQSLLDQLVDENLAAHGGDAEKSLAATDGLDVLRAELERVGDPDIQTTLDCIPAAGACTPPPPHTSQSTISCESRSTTSSGDLGSDDEPNRGDLIGRTISHYRVVERLGAGGMGVVYRAHDLALGRDAALKVLPAGFTSSLQSRFFREAWASARVQHPGIATFYEAGEVGGVDFIAMEYVPGRTLGDRLREGPLPIHQALDLVTCVLEALANAHAAGILHRDIKPANIMIAGDGSAKLLDFGLAKPLVVEVPGPPVSPPSDFTITPLDGTNVPTPSTETVQYPHRTVTHPLFGGPGTSTGAGVIAGSPGYMAPEQIRGEPVDVRTDLFAVGAVLYEVIEGHPAFSGATLAECLSATLGRDPPPLLAPDRPPGLDRVVARALERDPSRRYPSAGAFLAELRRVGTGAEVSARPSTLAILDFQELGGEGDSWIGDGIAEGLFANLAHVPGLGLIPRGVAMKARSSLVEDLEIGFLFDCRWLLSGSFQKSGQILHVMAKLWDVTTGEVLVEERLEGLSEDLAPLLNRLSVAIIEHLDLEGSTHEPRVALAQRLEAYRCYAQGRRLWLHHGTKGSFDESRELFEQAIAHDPFYVPALVSLAHLHAFRYNFTTETELLDAGADYARRAIAVDPHFTEAHLWLGYILNFQGRLLEAYEELWRAMELNPTDASAPYFAAWALSWASDPGDALRLHRHITGQPAPEDLHHWRRSEALRLHQRSVTLNPQHSWGWLATGWAHLELSHLMEARWCLERAVQLEGKALTSFPGAAGYLGECLRRMGELAEARRQCLAGLEAAERTDSMYRDTCRGTYLCTLGRIALQHDDTTAAKAAFRQAVLHVRGRPRARCGGHLIVQALAGATQAGEGPEPFEEALRLFEHREGWNFQYFYGCSEDMTLMALARAARTLGREEDARRLLERARTVGCTEALDEVNP